ncbi:IseA DL-endopeptidase inhibitor family protein [Heyndrickxia sp. NPDC080065]|uniref:IseA DL-endopeptidase inhibitor family protein n=1 Tax=Heyndrickxia sp. NPDC080065 TaxID=3390568 RepID=UPI003D05E682
MKKIFTAIIIGVIFLSSSLAAYAQMSSESLTASKALSIAQNARTQYWSALNGYDIKSNKTCFQKTFTYKKTEYRYLCKEFNTKKKLVNYLNKVFTQNAIEKGLKDYRFIKYKGKLAQPVGDGGSALNWNKAKGKVIYKKKGVRLFEFSVPNEETEKTVKVKVTFVNVKNKWLINALDSVR